MQQKEEKRNAVVQLLQPQMGTFIPPVLTQLYVRKIILAGETLIKQSTSAKKSALCANVLEQKQCSYVCSHRSTSETANPTSHL